MDKDFFKQSCLDVFELYFLELFDNDTKNRLTKSIRERLDPLYKGIEIEVTSPNGFDLNIKATYNGETVTVISESPKYTI